MSPLEANETIYNTFKYYITIWVLITSSEGRSQVLFDLSSATPDHSQRRGMILSQFLCYKKFCIAEHFQSSLNCGLEVPIWNTLLELWSSSSLLSFAGGWSPTVRFSWYCLYDPLSFDRNCRWDLAISPYIGSNGTQTINCNNGKLPMFTLATLYTAILT